MELPSPSLVIFVVHLVAPHLSGILDKGLVAQPEPQQIQGEYSIARFNQGGYVVSPVVHTCSKSVDEDYSGLVEFHA